MHRPILTLLTCCAFGLSFSRVVHQNDWSTDFSSLRNFRVSLDGVDVKALGLTVTRLCFYARELASIVRIWREANLTNS